MADSRRRLSEIVDTILADRGLRVAPSSPALRPSARDHSHLVFIGNWQDPCPRRLLFDPDLEPIDIVTWQVIRIHADPSKIVAFPSYQDLIRGVRVSRATIARALAVLRLTRWLPLCAALRDADGRFAGHVYALNDEPLPLTETLAIDEGYVDFVERTHSHRSAHVRKLAHETLEILRAEATDRDSRFEPVRIADHIAGRLGDMLGLAGDRVQNLNAVTPVQDLNPRSSSLKENTTTTPALTPPEPNGKVPLAFPSALALTDSQRRMLMLRLEQLPSDLRQDVLDEAAGRILAKRSTADPVRCQFDYVARLCARARENEFVFTDAGQRVRRARDQGAAASEQLERARRHTEEKRLEELERHRRRTEEPPGN